MGIFNLFISPILACPSCGVRGRFHLQFKYGDLRAYGPYQVGGAVEPVFGSVEPPARAVAEGLGECLSCCTEVSGDIYFQGWRITHADVPTRFYWDGLEPLVRGTTSPLEEDYPVDDSYIDLDQYPSETLWPRRDGVDGLWFYDWQWRRAKAVLQNEASTSSERRVAELEIAWIRSRAEAHLGRGKFERAQPGADPEDYRRLLLGICDVFGETATARDARALLELPISDPDDQLDWLAHGIGLPVIEMLSITRDKRRAAALIKKISETSVAKRAGGFTGWADRVDQAIEILKSKTRGVGSEEGGL